MSGSLSSSHGVHGRWGRIEAQGCIIKIKLKFTLIRYYDTHETARAPVAGFSVRLDLGMTVSSQLVPE